MQSSLFFLISLIIYIILSVLYIVNFIINRKPLAYVNLALLVIGISFHAVGLVLRMVESGHSPFVNMYETFVFLSILILIVYLVFELIYKARWLGAFVVPLAFLSIAAASVLPESYKASSPLVPALQSYWLEIHIITCFLGYAGFFISFILCILFLVKLRREGKNKPSKLPSSSVLDDMGYKAICFGFPFLTIGIIAGAIWANKAWGTYWGWDPKETWSLITWLIYAAYLHARIRGGWKGKKSAYFSIVGFASVIFTYVGVNYLLSGLHSYL